MKNKTSAKKGGSGSDDDILEAKMREPEEKPGKIHEKKADGKNGMKIAVSMIIAIAIIGGLYFFLVQQPAKNPYQLKFANETLNFRANLEKAASVPVIPDDSSVRSAILSGNVSKIRISYAPGEYNSFYAVDSFEIAYKLVIILKHFYGINGYVYEGDNKENCMFFEETAKSICISSEPVSSGNDMISNSSEPVIFMSASNETSVSLKGNIIYLKGKDFSEKGRTYTDLDMATDKFLMVLMG